MLLCHEYFVTSFADDSEFCRFQILSPTLGFMIIKRYRLNARRNMSLLSQSQLSEDQLSEDGFCSCWRLWGLLDGEKVFAVFVSTAFSFENSALLFLKFCARSAMRKSFLWIARLSERSPKNCWRKSCVISRNVPLFAISFYISRTFTPKVSVKYPSAQPFLAKFFLWDVVIHVVSSWPPQVFLLEVKITYHSRNCFAKYSLKSNEVKLTDQLISQCYSQLFFYRDIALSLYNFYFIWHGNIFLYNKGILYGIKDKINCIRKNPTFHATLETNNIQSC